MGLAMKGEKRNRRRQGGKIPFFCGKRLRTKKTRVHGRGQTYTREVSGDQRNIPRH